MSKFTDKYPNITQALNAAFDEGNAAVTFNEENSSADLGSEHLGAINKFIGDQRQQLKDANSSYEALGSQHATESKQKDEKITELQDEINVLKGSRPAKKATSALKGGESEIEEEEAVQADINPTYAHNKMLEEAGYSLK